MGDHLLASFGMNFSPMLIVLINVPQLHFAGYFNFKCIVYFRELFIFPRRKWMHLSCFWFTGHTSAM